MNKFYLYNNYGTENNAGPKAKEDINSILADEGYKGIKFSIPKNKYIRPIISSYIWKNKFKNIFKSLIVIQYPFYSHILEKSLAKEIKHQHKKENTFVAFIHDIESLRQNPNDKKKISEELNILNHFDYLVCHNERMKKWLQTNGITSKILVLNVFDYLSPEFTFADNDTYQTINFAGNLEKSKFLKEKFTNYTLNLFGPNFREEYNVNNNCHFLGEFSPEEVPKNIKSGFGLIWDGSGIDHPSGTYGNYLKYITPHKFSLYLRSGIPVIAWSKSAIGKYITDNQLGFVIDDLSELDPKINGISLDEYLKMRVESRKFSDKVKNGFFTKRILQQIETECEF